MQLFLKLHYNSITSCSVALQEVVACVNVVYYTALIVVFFVRLVTTHDTMRLTMPLANAMKALFCILYL